MCGVVRVGKEVTDRRLVIVIVVVDVHQHGSFVVEELSVEGRGSTTWDGAIVPRRLDRTENKTPPMSIRIAWVVRR